MQRNAPRLTAAILSLGLIAAIYLTIRPAFHIAIISCAAIVLFLYCLRPDAARAMMPRAPIVAIGMPVLAWSLPNVWVLYAAMLAWVPLVAGRRSYIVPLYLYSLLLLPGLDETIALGSIKLFDFGVHDALGLGAAAALLPHAGKARPRVMLDLPAVSVMLLLIAALARDTSLTNFLRVAVNVTLDLGLPYYIVSRGVRTIDEFRTAMLWLGCGGITLSAILIYETWASWPIYNQLYAYYDVSTLLIVKARGGVLRSGGPFVEPTSAAMVLATCVLALWLSRDYLRSRWQSMLLFAFALIGLSAPQSRGAWLGLLTALAMVLVFRGRYAQLVRSAIVIGAAGAMLFLAAQVSPYLSETMGLSGGSSETSQYRRLLFDRGIEEFWHSPVWGYSMPQVTLRLSDLRQGEGIVDFVNSYIWILLISGAIGTLIFVGAFVNFLLRMLKFRRPIGGDHGNVIAGSFVFAGLAMPMEMLFFTSFGGRPGFFVFVMFGFAAAFITIRERESSALRQQRADAPAAWALGVPVRTGARS
jgi:hypothetical protein